MSQPPICTEPPSPATAIFSDSNRVPKSGCDVGYTSSTKPVTNEGWLQQFWYEGSTAPTDSPMDRHMDHKRPPHQQQHIETRIMSQAKFHCYLTMVCLHFYSFQAHVQMYAGLRLHLNSKRRSSSIYSWRTSCKNSRAKLAVCACAPRKKMTVLRDRHGVRSTQCHCHKAAVLPSNRGTCTLTLLARSCANSGSALDPMGVQACLARLLRPTCPAGPAVSA